MNNNQMIVSEEKNGLFSKAIKNLQNTLFLSNKSFKSLIINRRRNQIIKAYLQLSNISNIADSKKRGNIEKKFKKVYSDYLTVLLTYLTETIYTRVKANKGSYAENKLIEEYLQIVQNKENDYIIFKYARQRFLLERDIFNVLKMSNLYIIEQYKKFYVYKMDEIYKTILKTYSIKIIDDNSRNKVFDEMFLEIEKYVLQVLPYKLELSSATEKQEQYKDIIIDSKRLEEYKYDDNNDMLKYIKKNSTILSISRGLFSYSFPIIIAEQCYIKLLKDARNLLVMGDSFNKKNEAYELIIELIEEYNIKLLSKKAYWDDPKIRVEYEKFWKEYQRIMKLENIDYDECKRQKESLFIYYDLKLLNRKDTNKYDDIKQYYRIKLKELKGLKKIRNNIKIMKGKFHLIKDK